MYKFTAENFYSKSANIPEDSHQIIWILVQMWCGFASVDFPTHKEGRNFHGFEIRSCRFCIIKNLIQMHGTVISPRFLPAHICR